jgi:hypothetical protein
MDENSIENDISLIHEISDVMAFRIITSIRDSPKAASQISLEITFLSALLIKKSKNSKNMEL